jgi:hypothetical protein
MNLGLIDYAAIFAIVCGALYFAILCAANGTVGDALGKAVANVIKRIPKTTSGFKSGDGSPALLFSWEDLFQVLKHTFFIGVAAGMAYLADQVIPNVDQSTATGILLVGAASVVLKVLRQWLPNTQS